MTISLYREILCYNAILMASKPCLCCSSNYRTICRPLKIVVAFPSFIIIFLLLSLVIVSTQWWNSYTFILQHVSAYFLRIKFLQAQCISRHFATYCHVVSQKTLWPFANTLALHEWAFLTANGIFNHCGFRRCWRERFCRAQQLQRKQKGPFPMRKRNPSSNVYAKIHVYSNRELGSWLLAAWRTHRD